MEASLKIRSNVRARAAAGHPWVFTNEVEQLLPADQDGSVVPCRDRDGRIFGHGIYNSRSQIVWRRLAREKVVLDEAFLRTAVAQSVQRRRELGAGRADFVGRLVWSEGDGLPGVVADQFGEILVVQIQTLAMDRQADLIGRVLTEAAGAREVVFRNDSNLRRLEGLAMEVRTLGGAACPPRWVGIDGFRYWLDFGGGQKTGFYLDQRRQHRLVAGFAAGRRVLDAFCNQGSFALHCARAGASRVLGLDSSGEAISGARRNAKENDVAVDFEEANVFDWFSARKEDAATWDMVVLDPPPFAKSRGSLDNAMRGYKELNLRALKLLAPGGILASYTCSHHMGDAELRQVLSAAAGDARRRVQVLEWGHQPPDHPVLVTMPESEYLRGYIVRVD